jgi:recombinational DNA repair protein RecT
MNNITALEKVVKENKNDLWSQKAEYLTTGKEIWFSRALMEISGNEYLAKVAENQTGQESIITGLGKALQLGLMIGGVIPHCYLVPQSGRVRLDITIDGYKFIACGGKNPVISDFVINAVYEKEADKLEIDFAQNTVKNHKAYLLGDRGELVGVYCIITHLNGKDQVKWLPRKEIDRIRNDYSKGYQAYLDKKVTTSTWISEYDKMAIKTAGKQFLKEFASRKESLKMALDSEEIPETPADRIIHNVPAIEVKKEDVKVENSEPEKETKKTGKLFGEK